MKLLTAALVIVFLTAASAKPIGWRRRWRQRPDADITDNRWIRGWPYGNKWWSLWCADSSSYEDQSDESLQSSSSESSESQSSEESSEEIQITERTTPAVTTTTEEGSTFSPEPDTRSTDGPDVTPEAGTPTPPAGITKPKDVTDCVTLVIPTGAPITNNRGDN